MELAYLRSSGRVNDEMYAYFFLRFGQPRHLASLCLLQALPGAGAPVLDLACGFGHSLHHLAARERPVTAVGVDRNFFQLWVARRYVAPTQSYVCTDRVDALPFDDDGFSASTCTDAFHYFGDQQRALDELRRVARHDTVVVDRIGNRNCEPRDGDAERDPAGYVALLRGAPWRLLDEDDLVDTDRAGFGPQLATPRPPGAFARVRWLTLVSSTDPALLTDHGPTTGRPHALGLLRPNPAHRVRHEDGDVVLSYAFPSTWYAFENATLLSYTSPGERFAPDVYAALARGGRTPWTDELVERFVLLGLPDRYAR
ncbi:class I SAM-dependent methyltransferase [Actinomycetospora sp. C-140]